DARGARGEVPRERRPRRVGRAGLARDPERRRAGGSGEPPRPRGVAEHVRRRPMNQHLVGALALTLVLAAIPASAQDARVEAARKEGKVVWYTSLALSSSERVAKLFEAAYPGIGVEVHRTGSQRILQRVMQELQANLRLVDV